MNVWPRKRASLVFMRPWRARDDIFVASLFLTLAKVRRQKGLLNFSALGT